MYVNLFRRGLGFMILAGLFAAVLGAQAPVPTLLSHANGTPTTAANAASSSLGMSSTTGVSRFVSDDGRYVVVNSRATDLVSGFVKSNSAADLFLLDRVSSTYKLISHVPGSTTQTGNGGSGTATISADGLWVAFTSAATDLVSGVTDTNGQSDVFLYDVANDTVRLVSRSGSNPNATANGRTIGAQISADGRYVASYTLATDFAPGITDTNGTNDIVLYDRNTDTNRIVTHTAASTTTTFTAAGSQPDAFRISFALSADYLIYICGGTDLVASQVDTNTFGDLFCYDIAANTNTLITHTFSSNVTAATAACYSGAISADGNYVLYHHNASNLVNGTDTNSNFDLFLWDRNTNTNTLVSHVAGQPTTASSSITVSGPPPLPAVYNGVISADGRYCAYFHGATDLVSGQSGSGSNLFLYDRVTGTNTLVTRQPGSTTIAIGGMEGMGGNLDAAMSADGRYLAFACAAANLVTGVTDSNGVNDIFLFDRTSGSNVLLSRTLGSATTTANGTPSRLTISRNGALVVFQSTATDMAVTDTNAASDLIGVPLGALVGNVSPAGGSTVGGYTVTVTGRGFSGVTAASLGGNAVSALNVASDTSLTFTAPAHAVGVVDLALVSAFTTVTATGVFTYNSPPLLNNVAPSSGPATGGTSVTLTGSAFTGTTSVTFGGVAATFTVNSDTSISATTPAHAVGAVSVIVTNPLGSNAANTAFTYTVPAPTVGNVSPASGDVAGGYTATITGTSFVSVSGVTFGGTAATNVSATSSTTVTCTVPSHAAGVVSVEVTTATGTSAANTLFTYFVPAAPQQLDITRSGTPVGHGSVDTTPPAQAGTGLTLIYTLSNLGGQDIVLAGPVTHSGANNCAVSLVQPATTITGGNSSPLEVTVTPAASGSFSVVITVASNDPTQNPWSWTVSGTAAPSTPNGGGSKSGGSSGGGCAAGAGSLPLLALLLPMFVRRRRR
ncbi:MAG: IPT/TIG domain-containing protein [Planctomycetes bacterium]|nr:IPT/TIG domain-containing protein [Planctomycetota bacterium]